MALGSHLRQWLKEQSLIFFTYRHNKVPCGICAKVMWSDKLPRHFQGPHKGYSGEPFILCEGQLPTAPHRPDWEAYMMSMGCDPSPISVEPVTED